MIWILFSAAQPPTPRPSGTDSYASVTLQNESAFHTQSSRGVLYVNRVSFPYLGVNDVDPLGAYCLCGQLLYSSPCVIGGFYCKHPLLCLLITCDSAFLKYNNMAVISQDDSLTHSHLISLPCGANLLCVSGFACWHLQWMCVRVTFREPAKKEKINLWIAIHNHESVVFSHRLKRLMFQCSFASRERPNDWN